jgi:hypothetical protein
MDWKSLAGNVAALAPTLGAAIGGPVGSVAGIGVKALCGLFGVEPTADDAAQQVEVALNQMTPEQATALKQGEMQFKRDMKALDIDVFKLETADRDSARKMQVSTGSWTPHVLAGLVVVGWGMLNYFICSAPADMPNKDLIMRVLGTADAALMLILSFFFGASHKDG